MLGTSAETGKDLSGIQHLRQSIRDILTTPIGSRVLMRSYGSMLPRLVDAPVNPQTLVEIYAATAQAILLWEPRISLDRVSVQAMKPGQVVLDLFGKYQGQPIAIEGVEV